MDHKDRFEFFGRGATLALDDLLETRVAANKRVSRSSSARDNCQDIESYSAMALAD